MSKKYYINLIANSNPNSGSVGLNSLGNRFSLNLTPSIRIPQEARNIKCYARSANIWYSFVNVAVSKNNNKIFFTDSLASPSKYTLTLPDGLYSLDLLSSAIQRELQNFKTLSGFTGSSTLITLTGDEASQRSIVNIDSSGYQINWADGTPYDLLGITKDRKMPSSTLSTGSTNFLGDETANFSNLTNLVIQTSLTSSYIYNGKSSNVLDIVPIDVPPNSLIVYRPSPNFTYVDTPELQGSSISSISFSLLDQDLGEVNTNSEYWNVAFTIEYEL